MPYKICFRGDNRAPSTGAKIFSNGFQKRNPVRDIHYRTHQPTRKAGDITPETAVCFSARLSAAAIFPLRQDPAKPNYIYMMAVDTSTIFNTHMRQVEDSFEIMAQPEFKRKVNPKTINPSKIMWPVFAQEYAADSVPAANIIAAVPFTRIGDWQRGGTYTLCEFTDINLNCTVPDEVRSVAEKFLASEVLNHRTAPLATIASGFHPSVSS